MFLSQARESIEKIHLEFLCENFKLRRALPSISPKGYEFDLTADKNLFELKSRTFPKNQNGHYKKRPKSDYEWWKCEVKQTEVYEHWAKVNEYSLYWLFLRGDTQKSLTQINSLNEDSIIKREIYLLPWKTYNIVNPDARGTARHIGLTKIKRNYDFESKEINKGIIHLEKSNASLLKKYFF